MGNYVRNIANQVLKCATLFIIAITAFSCKLEPSWDVCYCYHTTVKPTRPPKNPLPLTDVAVVIIRSPLFFLKLDGVPIRKEQHWPSGIEIECEEVHLKEGEHAITVKYRSYTETSRWGRSQFETVYTRHTYQGKPITIVQYFKKGHVYKLTGERFSSRPLSEDEKMLADVFGPHDYTSDMWRLNLEDLGTDHREIATSFSEAFSEWECYFLRNTPPLPSGPSYPCPPQHWEKFLSK